MIRKSGYRSSEKIMLKHKKCANHAVPARFCNREVLMIDVAGPEITLRPHLLRIGCGRGRCARDRRAMADRGPARSAAGAPDQLANLDQVPVGVAHVTADLAATVDRRGQKLRSAGAPLLIDGGDVGDTDVQEARGVIWIRRGHERYGGLVVGRSSADTDGDPAVRQGDDRELTLKHCLAAEHLGVEAPGALNVPG